MARKPWKPEQKFKGYKDPKNRYTERDMADITVKTRFIDLWKGERKGMIDMDHRKPQRLPTEEEAQRMRMAIMQYIERETNPLVIMNPFREADKRKLPFSRWSRNFEDMTWHGVLRDNPSRNVNLVAIVPSQDQIQAGLDALDDYYEANPDGDRAVAIELAYRAMVRFVDFISVQENTMEFENVGQKKTAT